jgi:osmotically-inducible protein OsmY
MHKNRLPSAAAPTRLSTLQRALAVAALLSAATWAPLAHANSIVGATPDDVALATQVQSALLKDKIFQEPNVDIVVRSWQGKVNLSGWVGNSTDDAQARRIAASVGGVKSVTTNLRSWSSEGDERTGVSAPASNAPRASSLIGATSADLALASTVQSALLKERNFQAADVDIVVRASGDKVNLSGWIGDVNDETLARKIAGAVPGVRMVSSNLRSWSTEGETNAGTAGRERMAMTPASNTIGATDADRTLASQVRAAVLQGKTFQDADVDIVVRAAQGRVNLSGWVSYAGNADQARKLAAGVPGVKSVTSDFKSWSTDTDPRR